MGSQPSCTCSEVSISDENPGACFSQHFTLLWVPHQHTHGYLALRKKTSCFGSDLSGRRYEYHFGLRSFDGEWVACRCHELADDGGSVLDGFVRCGCRSADELDQVLARGEQLSAGQAGIGVGDGGGHL